MKISPVVAVTLGSNGFHLIEVSLVEGKMETTQHLYENVQAELYIDSDGRLVDEGVQLILAAMHKFGSYLKTNPGTIVGAIATGTFRRAVNSAEVLSLARQALGTSIQVLSGRDESLLCYIGIASSVGLAEHDRLVIDIGGGSTEIMIARRNFLIEFSSINIGCVSLTTRAFSIDPVKQQNFDEAAAIVEEEFAPVVEKFSALGWEEAMGCGGTVSSLYSVLRVNRMGGRYITAAGLERFRDAVNDSGSALALCDGVAPDDRAKLLPAGAAILDMIYRSLNVEKLLPVFSSVGQGLLVKLIKHQSDRL